MKSKYSVKNSITSFISNIISIIFVFLSQSIFIKTLGIEYSGLNGLFSNILAIINLFELGIGSAIAFHLYKYTKDSNEDKIISILNYCKKLYFVIVILILCFGLLTLPFISFFIKEVTIEINIYIIYLLFIINTISTYFLIHKRILLYSFQRNYIINIIHIFYIIIVNIIQILVIIFTKNYYLYLIIKILCIILENIAISIKANKDYQFIQNKNNKKITIKEKKDIKTRVRALAIHKTSAAITYGTDNILISSFFGLTELGLYNNYHYIINAVTTLFQGLISSTGASVGVMLNEKESDNYFVFRRIKYLNHFLAIFTSVSLLVLVEPFITLWLGKKYLMDSFVLIILVINYYQLFMRTSFNTFKDAAGIWVEDRVVAIIQSIVNLVVSIIMLHFVGLSGIFIGTIVSSFTVWFYSYPKYIYKGLFKISYGDYYKEFIWELFVFIVIMIITIVIVNIITFDSIIISFIIRIIIVATIPNILFILLNDKKYFIYYVNLVKKILK